MPRARPPRPAAARAAARSTARSVALKSRPARRWSASSPSSASAAASTTRSARPSPVGQQRERRRGAVGIGRKPRREAEVDGAAAAPRPGRARRARGAARCRCARPTPLGVARCDRRRGQLGRVRLELEAQPRRVARDPPQPRRVVAEARVVQHAQAPGVEIVERVLGGAQLAAAQVERDRVDRHVAAQQVLVDRGAGARRAGRPGCT